PQYRGFLKLGSMPEQPDPFTGAWRFNPQLSKLSTQSPRYWIQEILSNFDEVHVREKIVTADGSETVVSVRAKFDGEAHPVEGSPAARHDRLYTCGSEHNQRDRQEEWR